VTYVGRQSCAARRDRDRACDGLFKHQRIGLTYGANEGTVPWCAHNGVGACSTELTGDGDVCVGCHGDR
jgi:hypothetical protein